MDKKYNINKNIKKIYNLWQKKKFLPFKKNKKYFSIIMPPPNITGKLHIGHAFQQIIMDVINRYKKMKGRNTLWIMGTDHAGIATQIIIENYTKTKNIKKLIKKTWKWKEKYEKKIFYQTKILGSLVDWNKTFFSLDKNFSYAVKKAFIKLYKENLIYKSFKIVYWEPKTKKIISDLEIEKKKKKINLWYIKYPLINNKKNKHITIATTKPETITGDVALAVHPKNKKYKKYINKYVLNPINNNILKIIPDDSIKLFKGTGCIKITPAHSVKDFEIAQKNKLNIINILNTNGTIKLKSKIFNYKGEKIKSTFNLKNPPEIINLNIKEAKKKIINILKKKKLLKKKITYKSNIRYSIKNNNKVEPLLTTQWYLKTSILALKTIKIIKKNKIIFYPKKYKNICITWIKNMKDWCISRQIWWGHKIPIWYDEKHNIYLGLNKKYIKKKYNVKKITQDKNILDTWFSSSLWPLVTSGWPKKKLKIFYPINLVVSGFDIIFFWITRMIIMSLYFTKKIPFKKIFITGLIRDENGIKMSKSIGNVIDPIDLIKGITLKKLIKKRTKNLIKKKSINIIIKNTKKKFPQGIKEYGIDALRFMLANISTPNIKINLDFEKINNSYYLCNKIWNSCRYIYININKKNILIQKKKIKNFLKLSLINKWILNHINILTHQYKKYTSKCRIDLLCKKIYFFIKYKFCDWYIEFNKIKLSKYILLIMENILKLIHPIIPFTTELIWLKFKKIKNFPFNKKKLIIEKKFPKYNFNINKKDKTINKIIDIITYIRNIKYKLKNKNIINLYITNLSLVDKLLLYQNRYLFKILHFLNKIYFFYKIKIINKNFINLNLLNLKTKLPFNLYIKYIKP